MLTPLKQTKEIDPERARLELALEYAKFPLERNELALEIVTDEIENLEAQVLVKQNKKAIKEAQKELDAFKGSGAIITLRSIDGFLFEELKHIRFMAAQKGFENETAIMKAAADMVSFGVSNHAGIPDCDFASHEVERNGKKYNIVDLDILQNVYLRYGWIEPLYTEIAKFNTLSDQKKRK